MFSHIGEMLVKVLEKQTVTSFCEVGNIAPSNALTCEAKITCFWKLWKRETKQVCSHSQMRHTELNVLFASQAIQWVLFPPYLQHLELLLRHIIYVLSLYCSTATHKNDSITFFIHINIIGILLSVSHSPWDRNGQSNNTLLNLKGKVLLLGCWDLMQPLLPMASTINTSSFVSFRIW